MLINSLYTSIFYFLKYLKLGFSELKHVKPRKLDSGRVKNLTEIINQLELYMRLPWTILLARLLF